MEIHWKVVKPELSIIVVDTEEKKQVQNCSIVKKGKKLTVRVICNETVKLCLDEKLVAFWLTDLLPYQNIPCGPSHNQHECGNGNVGTGGEGSITYDERNKCILIDLISDHFFTHDRLQMIKEGKQVQIATLNMSGWPDFPKDGEFYTKPIMNEDFYDDQNNEPWAYPTISNEQNGLHVPIYMLFNQTLQEVNDYPENCKFVCSPVCIQQISYFNLNYFM